MNMDLSAIISGAILLLSHLVFCLAKKDSGVESVSDMFRAFFIGFCGVKLILIGIGVV